MFTLHVFPPAPNARKPLAVCKHLGLEPELRIVKILEGGGQDPEYRAINPWGLVPALVDGDLRLWESNAVCIYIAEAHGDGTDLWGHDARERADISRWLYWESAHWLPAVGPIVFENFVRGQVMGQAPDTARVAAAEQNFHRLAAVFDEHLSTRPYVAQGRLTLADFSLAAALTYAGPGRVPIAGYANIGRWLAGLDQVPAWRATAPR